MSYQIYLKTVDKLVKSPKLRHACEGRHDVKGRFKTFYETITVGQFKFICP